MYLIGSQSVATRALLYDIYIRLTLQKEVEASTRREVNTVIKASPRWKLGDACLTSLVNCESDTLLKRDETVGCVFISDSNFLIEEVAVPSGKCRGSHWKPVNLYMFGWGKEVGDVRFARLFGRDGHGESR